jgi:hypothetical protein
MAKVRVYYKGLSDVRIIGADHLKEAHNIEVSEDLVWDRLGEANGGVLKAPRLAINIDAPDELIKVLRDNDTFTVSEIKDDGSVGDDIVTGKVVDESTVAAKVVDATTGATSAGKGKSSGS